MSKKLIALALMLMLLPVPVHAAEFHYACASDLMYIYGDNDADSEKLATLTDGDICRVLEDGKSWSRVFSGGYTGYVRTALLNTDEDRLENIHSRYGIAADTDIKIYSRPDTSSTVIAERQKGATELFVDDSGEEEGWFFIQIVIDAEGTVETGWVEECDVTPARIVDDAEPYMGDIEEDGFEILSSNENRERDAKTLREKADQFIQSAKSARNKLSGKGNTYTVSAKPGVLNRQIGTIIGPSDCKETYYNLPMGGVVKIMRRQGYSEEEYPYWVRDDGAKMLGPYIMCAADLNLRPRGSLVESSLGTCIVADTGDFIYSNPTQIDIATDW